MMTIAEILQAVQFIVGQEGKPTAVVLDIETWEALLSVLEDVEDIQLVQDRLNNWQTKEGWTRWEESEAEIDASSERGQQRLVYGQFAGENMSTLDDFTFNRRKNLAASRKSPLVRPTRTRRYPD